MATFTKTIPLIFNKVFLLSQEEPSEEIRKNSNFLYSSDDRDEILNSIKEYLPPLIHKEKYNAFWLDESLCEHIEMFDELYPNSKFIFINSDNSNNEINKKVITYFFSHDDAIKYLANANIQYNDIFPKEDCVIEMDSSKFIRFDSGADDINKINNFLIDPIIVQPIHNK